MHDVTFIFVRAATFGQLAKALGVNSPSTFSTMNGSCCGRTPNSKYPARARDRNRRFAYGTIAKTRAGNPEPPFGFGKLTTTIAPDSGI